MKKLSVFGTRLAVVAFWLFAGMLSITFALQAEENQIVVNASGTVSVKPDTAEFGVVVRTEARTAEKAAAETASRHRAVQDALRGAGISQEDAPSSSYTVSPRWEWDPSAGRNSLKGYIARHVIMVKVRKLDGIGRAIDAAVQGGADEVQNITFSSSRFEALREQALASAIENARKDAGIMAKSAGGRLGQLVEASVSQSPIRERPQLEFMAMKAAPAPVSTEISPSEEDITVNVSTRWRFIGTPLK